MEQRGVAYLPSYKRRSIRYTSSRTPKWSDFCAERVACGPVKSRFFVLLLILCMNPLLFSAGYIFVANTQDAAVVKQARPGSLGVFSKWRTISHRPHYCAAGAFLLNCWVGPVNYGDLEPTGSRSAFLGRPFRRPIMFSANANSPCGDCCFPPSPWLLSPVCFWLPSRSSLAHNGLDLVAPMEDRTHCVLFPDVD